VCLQELVDRTQRLPMRIFLTELEETPYFTPNTPAWARTRNKVLEEPCDVRFTTGAGLGGAFPPPSVYYNTSK